jgi:hypothetical protein
VSVSTWKGEPGDDWLVRSANGEPVLIADQGVTVGADYMFVAWSPDLLQAHLDKRIARRDGAQLTGAHEPKPRVLRCALCGRRARLRRNDGTVTSGPALLHRRETGDDVCAPGDPQGCAAPKLEPTPEPESTSTPVVIEPAAKKPSRGAAKALFDLASEGKANEHTPDKTLIDLLEGKTGHRYSSRHIQNAKTAVREHGWPKPA